MEPSPIIYRYLIDPLLQSIRERIYNNVPSGSKVLDIACGTGALVDAVAPKARHVTGIDIDEAMIRYANKKNGRSNVEFIYADAKNLEIFSDRHFDVITMSMAYHQFPSEDRQLILQEAQRIGKIIIITDYAFPLPSGYKKTAVYIIERMAGRDHFRNFRSYMNEGGLAKISEISFLKEAHEELSGSGIFSLVKFIR